MTQNIDFNELTTDREILQHYREYLEHGIKDLFIRAWGESATTEITRNQHYSLLYRNEMNSIVAQISSENSREKRTAEDV